MCGFELAELIAYGLRERIRERVHHFLVAVVFHYPRDMVVLVGKILHRHEQQLAVKLLGRGGGHLLREALIDGIFEFLERK